MVSRRTRVASWIFRRDHPSRPNAMICCFAVSFRPSRHSPCCERLLTLPLLSMSWTFLLKVWPLFRCSCMAAFGCSLRITGIQLCEHIRRDFKTSYVYIIILTSMTDTDKVVSGLAAGADDYLTKPFRREELIARVGVGHRVIDLHRQIEAKNRQLEELALTDTLTALPNRRAVETWAARQLNGAARYGFSFWAVMADVDCFKSINDTYGHDAGDTVLKKIAEILRINTRSSNICARIGGEEFLIVLTHAERDQVEVAIERIRKQV